MDYAEVEPLQNVVVCQVFSATTGVLLMETTVGPAIVLQLPLMEKDVSRWDE